LQHSKCTWYIIVEQTFLSVHIFIIDENRVKVFDKNGKENTIPAERIILMR